MDKLTDRFTYYKDSFLLSCALILVLVYWRSGKEKRKCNLPPGPWGVPILGYLPFLGKEPFRDFHDLCKRYGNVFSLSLGQTSVVILGDYETAKEALSKSSTCNRPERFLDFIPDGVGFTSTNGEEWIEQRKYNVKVMRKIILGRSKWENIVQEEIQDFIKSVQSFEERPTNIFGLLTLSVSNNISSLLFDTRLQLDEKNVVFIPKWVDSIFLFFSQTSWRIYVPLFYDLLTKLKLSKYARTHEQFVQFNNYIRREIELQKETFLSESTDSYIHSYLKEIQKNEERNLGNSFNEIKLCGNIQALYLAGTGTIKISLCWLLLAMAKYSDIQKKVQEEIDSVLGKDRNIQWSERASLPYTYAVILEAQRWRTISPLNALRVAKENIKVGGYDILKGTNIIINNWGLHNDTRYWKKPENFIPERFLTKDGKHFITTPDSYVPFSSGKRGCPGSTVALMEILYYFVTLMQKFTVHPPENEAPNIKGILGFAYQTTPQKLRLICRQ